MTLLYLSFRSIPWNTPTNFSLRANSPLKFFIYMKRVFVIAAAAVMGTFAFVGCQKDVQSSSLNASAKNAKPAPVNPGSCTGYQVSLAIDKLSEPGKTIFTWTIINPKPGNGANGTLQNLSHWDFVPSTCLDNNWQDLLSASVNTGSGWMQILPTPMIQPDPSMNNGGNACYANDVFKFNFGTNGSTPTQYRIVMLGSWNTSDLTVYYKSGATTGCCTTVLPGKGIGCREDEPCSFSQGYWFANNEMHPGGVHPWPADANVAGQNYTNAEGLDIWNASNAGGIKDMKKGFTQLAALRLSTAGADPSALSAAITTIESWLGSIGEKVSSANLRNQTAAEIALYGNANLAAETIGEWINANHCE